MASNQWMKMAAGAFLSGLSLCAHAEDCKPPELAPLPLAGYTLATCEHKSWDVVPTYVPDHKIIMGETRAFHYELLDQKKSNDNPATRMYYIAVLQKAGATLVTDPGKDDAIFDKKGPEGETWYFLLQHNTRYTIETIKVLPLVQEVVAKPMTVPLDPSNPACQDPPWLAKQFSIFKIQSCDKKGWDSLPIDLPGGHQQLEGPRVTVTYQLIDHAEAPVGYAVGQNYVMALQAIGAKLLSNPDKISDSAVMSLDTPTGPMWLDFERGSGNSSNTLSYSLMTMANAPMHQDVVAQAEPAAGLQDHGKTCAYPPWLVKQFSYYKLDQCSFKDFDSFDLDLPEGKKTIAGRVEITHFSLSDSNQDPIALFVEKNYENALTGIGAPPVTKSNRDRLIAMQKTDRGEYWYIYTKGNGNERSVGTYNLTTIQIGGPPPKACTLEIYGVNFDFDKSQLRADSTPVLEQVLALFTGDAAFAAEIGGHTDNVGNAPYNLKLSDARAGAVKDWLIQHGVAAAKVSARGYGDTKPQVPNSSDENRAKNRRVELKRVNCK